MRFSVLFLIFFLAHASIIDDYKNGNYEKICNFKMLEKYKKNEKILSVIGDSCVKSDRLFLLPYLIKYLRHTQIGRRNAIYFLTIFNEKRLLYAFLFDNFDLKDFSFPRTDYILSVVFDSIKRGNYKKIPNGYIIELKNYTIKFYKKDDKMVVDEIKNNLKRHWYR